ncbi:MAG: sigma-54-dependent Fis family transcriptional regulator, partial [Acidobacteria bacterium]
QLLDEHPWPGNVDELQNLLRRLVAHGNEAQTQREVRRARAQVPLSQSSAAVHQPESVAQAQATTQAAATAHQPPGSLKEIARAAARAAECSAIARMLQRTRWNRKEAAEILGISYKALLYKIKENGLDKPSPAR